MPNIIAGATDYRDWSEKEITEEFIKFVKYTKDIFHKRKGHSEIENMPTDLGEILNEITSFAEKLIALSNKHLKKLKRGKPQLLFVKSLQEMGRNAHELFLKTGEVWHGKYSRIDYGSKYTDTDVASEYARFKNYVGSMMDLNNIGFELDRRCFIDGKPLYSEKKYLIPTIIAVIGGVITGVIVAIILQLIF